MVRKAVESTSEATSFDARALRARASTALLTCATRRKGGPGARRARSAAVATSCQALSLSAPWPAPAGVTAGTGPAAATFAVIAATAAAAASASERADGSGRRSSCPSEPSSARVPAWKSSAAEKEAAGGVARAMAWPWPRVVWAGACAWTGAWAWAWARAESAPITAPTASALAPDCEERTGRGRQRDW
jgi:hypothetical protein